MERIITTDIRQENGDIAYPKGRVCDYPWVTWTQIAHTLGKSVDEFSRPVEEMGDLMGDAQPPRQKAGGRKSKRR